MAATRLGVDPPVLTAGPPGGGTWVSCWDAVAAALAAFLAISANDTLGAASGAEGGGLTRSEADWFSADGAAAAAASVFAAAAAFAFFLRTWF